MLEQTHKDNPNERLISDNINWADGKKDSDLNGKKKGKQIWDNRDLV